MKKLNVDELVKLNNEKRKLLTEENEAYYSDLLVYIRTHWRISEQQTEEVLMEMLDHLLDAQNEGKSAKDIFGDDPLSFADHVIEEIADEKPRNIIKFVLQLVVLILGWTLIIRGATLIVLSTFKEVNEAVNLLQTTVAAIGIILFILINVWMILQTIKKNLFIYPKDKKRDLKAMNRVGLTAGLSMLILLLAIYFTPKMGPEIHFSSFASFIIGGVLILLHYLNKKIAEK